HRATGDVSGAAAEVFVEEVALSDDDFGYGQAAVTSAVDGDERGIYARLLEGRIHRFALGVWNGRVFAAVDDQERWVILRRPRDGRRGPRGVGFFRRVAAEEIPHGPAPAGSLLLIEMQKIARSTE